MTKREETKQLALWILLGIVALLCITGIILATNTYTISFVMDNNTAQSIQSINWNALYQLK